MTAIIKTVETLENAYDEILSEKTRIHPCTCATLGGISKLESPRNVFLYCDFSLSIILLYFHNVILANKQNPENTYDWVWENVTGSLR